MTDTSQRATGSEDGQTPPPFPPGVLHRAGWICWEEEERVRGDDEEMTKLPRAPWEVGHTGDVSATDPNNYAAYETAVEWAEKVPGFGLGYCFRADGPFVGIDLDDCVVEDTISDQAREIIERCDSYTEFSPSGTGLHILVRGELDAGLKNEGEHVEMYDRDRFFTMTGDHLDATPMEIRDRPDVIADLEDEYRVEHDPADTDGPEPQTTGNSTDPAPSDGGDTHPLYGLSVEQVYPHLPVGENIPHPVHGSDTRANFKIHEGGETAICWRGQHAYGMGDGCGLGAAHLLAMEWRGTGTENCREVRTAFATDDTLHVAAYLEARERGLIGHVEPPFRAVRAVAAKLDMADTLRDGGKGAWAAYRACIRKLRMEHGITIPLTSHG